MLKRERQAYILHQVSLHNKVLSSTLSQEMQVSEDTIRRDLLELSEVGKVIKVHGGALSQSFNQTFYPAPNVYAQEEKKRIARKAASLIKDGMFVMTSGGTTILEMARCLPPGLKATFISSSIPAVLEYMQHPDIEVIMIGDKVSKNAKMTYGAKAIASIQEIKADLCFLGVNAIDIEHGVSDNDWDVVQVKRAMMAASRKTICLTIAEKIDSCQPFQVCPVKDLDLLITELDPQDNRLRSYKKTGIEIF